MGRTVHYSIKDDGKNKITKGQWKKVEELQTKYNNEYDFQCESLGLTMLNYFPHWPNFENGKFERYDMTSGGLAEKAWNLIETLLDQGKTIKQLEKMGMIWTQKGGYKGEEYLASGFTKTYEEDQDVEMVVKFLVEASKILKNTTIEVNDEGDVLGELYISITAGVIRINEIETKQHEKHLQELLKKGYDIFGCTSKSLTNLRKSKKEFKNGKLLNNIEQYEPRETKKQKCPYCGKLASRPHTISRAIYFHNDESGYPDTEMKNHKHDKIYL